MTFQVYVPGTEETDLKKIIQSLRAIAEALGGASVTSVGTSGLATGGPITSTGTVAVAAASQSDQETGTSTAAAVTPGVQKYHPSAAKAWVHFSSAGAIQSSYNIASVSRTALGLYTVTFTTAFSSASYAALMGTNSAGIFAFGNGAQLAGSYGVRTYAPSIPGNADAESYAAFFGDQ